ncbi:MAG: vitamin K epoxide reductase family protein [Wenzhouxiangellaceae bacterium]
MLAGLGLLVTGYLGFVASISESPLFCGPDSGCDLIQSSSFSTLLGLPLALWGFGLYLMILWSALLMPARVSRWKRLVWLSGLGFLLSVYFTLTGIFSLDATCGWCLTSAAIMTALFVLLLVRRPDSGPEEGWLAFGRNLAIGTVFATGLVGAWQHGLLQPPENSELRALAEHLDASGAKYYGAYWCPNCQEQRRVFGRSADRLPYVECSPNGRGAMVAFECVAAGISAYPTWIINGRRFQQVLSVDELKRYSRFTGASSEEK